MGRLLDACGRDLVNHCVNDILVPGRAAALLPRLRRRRRARARDTMVERVLAASRDGCRENGCALLGGETAEMPGFYQPGDYELVGIHRRHRRPRRRCSTARGSRPGDVAGRPALGRGSTPTATRWPRRILFDRLGLRLDDRAPASSTDEPWATALLAPHLSYLQPLEPLLAPSGAARHGAHHRRRPHRQPAARPARRAPTAGSESGAGRCRRVFRRPRSEKGEVDVEEMLRVFNMGIGMVRGGGSRGRSTCCRRLLERSGQRSVRDRHGPSRGRRRRLRLERRGVRRSSSPGAAPELSVTPPRGPSLRPREQLPGPRTTRSSAASIRARIAPVSRQRARAPGSQDRELHSAAEVAPSRRAARRQDQEAALRPRAGGSTGYAWLATCDCCRRSSSRAFPRRILNIHPSLLPAFPGLDAQRQALEYGVSRLGLHRPPRRRGLDTARSSVQRMVPSSTATRTDSLSARILEQEHRAYPEAVAPAPDRALGPRRRAGFCAGRPS